MASWMAATAIIIFRFNTDLLVERLEQGKGSRSRDIAIVSILDLVQLVCYIIAGLGQHFRWTGRFPLVVQIVALALCFLGYALFAWATASNTFFSRFVRVQTERGHIVVTGDPYHFVRHPAYFGVILMVFILSQPIEPQPGSPFQTRFD